jgi:hypothetical protein
VSQQRGSGGNRADRQAVESWKHVETVGSTGRGRPPVTELLVHDGLDCLPIVQHRLQRASCAFQETVVQTHPEWQPARYLASDTLASMKIAAAVGLVIPEPVQKGKACRDNLCNSIACRVHSGMPATGTTCVMPHTCHRRTKASEGRTEE